MPWADRGVSRHGKAHDPALGIFLDGASVWVIRNLVYSNFGRGVLSIREDEIAAELIERRTRATSRCSPFVVSSFFAGIAGAPVRPPPPVHQSAHLRHLKSTDILIMVYLGGIAFYWPDRLSAPSFTRSSWKLLRPLGIWRMVLMPLVLVLLMIYRPRGIMGMKEIRLFMPLRDLVTEKLWRRKKKEVPDASA